MALRRCLKCGTEFAVGLGWCPQCTSTHSEEVSDVPKITVHGGATNAAETDEATAVASTVEERAPYAEWTKDGLQQELRERGLTVSGSKDALVARLEESDAMKIEADEDELEEADLVPVDEDEED